MPKRRIANKKRPSARYKEATKKVDTSKVYSLADAIKITKETSTVKFDAAVEIHANLGINPKKGDQAVRSTVALPHGNGKKIIIAAVVSDDKQKEVKAAGATIVGGLELVDEIAKTGKINFDILVTTPDLMKDMAKVAKVLGPKGLMPNPKTDTVSPNPAKAVAELVKGKVSFRNDDTSNVHVSIGKISFTEKQLEDNIIAFVDALEKTKPSGIKGVFIKNMYMNATMGPSIRFSNK